MKENGQLQKLWKKWKPRMRNDCFASTVHPLGIDDLIFAILMVIGAFGLTWILLVVEMIACGQAFIEQ